MSETVSMREPVLPLRAAQYLAHGVAIWAIGMFLAIGAKVADAQTLKQIGFVIACLGVGVVLAGYVIAKRHWAALRRRP